MNAEEGCSDGTNEVKTWTPNQAAVFLVHEQLFRMNTGLSLEPSRLNAQALLAELINDRQTLQFLAIGTAAKHKMYAHT